VAHGLPGVVIVAATDGEERATAAGVASLETGEPLTPAHRFRIGSVTKPFVAAVVLQLVDGGALALDAPAAPFVDDVTVRQLLNHTSGLPNFDDDMVALFEPYRRDRSHRWTVGPRELLRMATERPRLFAPGEGWYYSGSNYVALGLLVEEATGSTLREQLRRRVIEPLGLSATDFVDGPARGIDGLARGYFPSDNPALPGDGEPVDVTELDLPFYGAGGGVISSAGDVARLLRALLGGDLVPRSLRHEMRQSVPSDWEETDRYGLGIGEISAVMGHERSPCGGAWGHIGFSAGYTTIALSSGDGRRQVVVCANGHVMSDEGWHPVGRAVWRAYCG
jgi:D-alanyl-D-alanine carboxypeptidase